MRIVRWIGIVVGLLLLAALSVPFLLNANQFRPLLESNLTAALGRDVKLGDLQLAILSGGVSANDLSIADDPSFSQTPFLRAKSLKIAVELSPLLFSHKLNVTGLTIDRPEISLLQTPAGDWNFSSLGAKSAAKPQPAVTAPDGKSSLDFSVKLVKIASGRVSLGTVHGSAKPRVLSKMDVELRDFSASSVFPFSVSAAVDGGGAIKMDGKAGPIDSTDAALTPVQISLKVTQLNLAASGFVDASSGIAGLVSLDGSVESNGKSAQLKGRIRAEQLKLAKKGSPASRPLEFDFAIDHDLQRRAGVLSRGDIHVGAAPASLTGSYSRRGESTVLKMNLSGPSMAVQELTAMLPALGVALPAGSSLQGGTAAARLALEGPTDQLVTTGTLSLNNTKLAGFDLGAKLSSIATLAGIQAGPDTQIQIFSANVRVDRAGTRADAVKLIAPSIGELNGDGTVSAEHALDFKMRAMLHAVGQTTVPFLVAGTTTNPVFRPDMKGIASEEVKSIVNKKAGGLLDRVLGRKR